MRIYDMCVFSACIVIVVLLSFVVGCNRTPMMRAGGTRNMPFLEMDFSPPEAQVRSLVRNRTIRSGDGGDKWAVEDKRAWKYIVMHHSATRGGNAAEFDRMRRDRGWDELGYHFVITNGDGGPDGQVQAGPRWWKQKWGAHTGGTPDNEYNEYGIGICLVGNFMDHNPTQAQLKSARELTAYLMETYDIPMRDLIGHKEAPNANTECCGRVFSRYLHSTFKSQLRTQLATVH